MEHLDTPSQTCKPKLPGSSGGRCLHPDSQDALIPGTYDSLLGPDEADPGQRTRNSLEQAADDGWEVTRGTSPIRWGTWHAQAGLLKYYDGGTFP